MEKRKPSATDPHLIDNDKVLIVSTVMSAMDAEAEDLLGEVDSLMGRMRINPVSDIQE